MTRGHYSHLADYNLEPSDPCKEPDCTSSAAYRTKGYCLEHYEQYESDRADYLHDLRRDRELERRSDE